MEISVMESVSHVEPESSFALYKGNNKLLPISTSQVLVNFCKSVDKESIITLSSKHPNASSPSKPIPKTSDKLAQVIETCKKLQKASQSTKQESEKILNISSDLTENCQSVNGSNSETGTDVSASDLSKHSSDSTHDTVNWTIENVIDISSNINLSPTTSNFPSSISVAASEYNSDSLDGKRRLFYFRPSNVKDSGTNMYKCTVCGGMYRQKFSLKRHFLRTHINFSYISEADISNCKISVPDGYAQLDSSKTPNGRRKFKSSNAVFSDGTNGVSMPGLYVCHMCTDVKFDLEKELMDHYKEHSAAEGKKFQCDKCNASFLKKQILSRHLASHGERVFVKACKRCHVEFSSKIEYERHMASHSKGTVCQYCFKIYSNSANRKRHEALHLGLKPYQCTHCSMSFAQSKDLDRHLRKQHGELCHVCHLCNKLFPSQASLDIHLREKHRDISPKKLETSTTSDNVTKPNISKSVPVSDAARVKKICFVCKRAFQTFYAMMKHRRQAHPFHSKRRRHKKTTKQKMAQAKQIAKDQTIKIRKPYAKRAAKPDDTLPRPSGRPVRSFERTTRQNGSGRHSDHPAPKLLSKRDEELADKEHSEFLLNVSNIIVENLLHHVDGKIPQLSLKQYNCKKRRHPSCNIKERVRLPWTNYNFPNGYDVDHALKIKGQEIKNVQPENLSSQDMCLFATGLSRVEKPPQIPDKILNENLIDSDSSFDAIADEIIIDHTLNLEERKKLIGRKPSVVCLCCACGEKFVTREAFKEHTDNNHPNVDCSSIEIESGTKSPPVLQQIISPDGELFSYNVPPPLSDTSTLKCTKCQLQLQSVLGLHSHVIDCGNLKNFPRRVWKLKHERIKWTLKSRMSFARQEAELELNNKTFKTPEKRSFGAGNRISKSGGKVSKSVEKAQFYKNGRLQTTSLTANMNYFKTKPIKPVRTISKRGRKSYATLSYRYRNASLQTNSFECSECKEIFLTQAVLNIHLQNHCIQSTSKKKENIHIVSPFFNILDSTPTVMNSSTDGTVTSNGDIHELIHDNNGLENGNIKSPALPSFTKALPTSKTLVSCSQNIIEKASSNLSNSLSSIDCSRKMDLEAPMDLSKYSTVKNSCFDQSKDSVPKMSALKQCMETIQLYYQSNSSELSGKNAHISKLQETVEKVSSSNMISSPFPKPVGRPKKAKVGRPKKVKRLGPFHLRKNLTADINVNKSVSTDSKPVSKLEETVKRLTESKMKSDVYKEKVGLKANKSPISESAAVHVQSKQGLNILATNYFAQSAVDVPNKRITFESSKIPQTAPKTTEPVIKSTPKDFVPLIIYGDQSKLNSSPYLVGSQNNDKLSWKSKISTKLSKDSFSKGNILDDANEKSIEFDNRITPEKPSSKDNCDEDLPDFSNTEKSDKACRAGGSQGHISPSLESILDSIKQKLHSQEQESPHQDDAPLTWLEDEKFEIPPSRPTMKITNSEPISVGRETFLSISVHMNANQDYANSSSNTLQISSQIPFANSPSSTPCSNTLDGELGRKDLSPDRSRKAESILHNESDSSSKLEDNVSQSSLTVVVNDLEPTHIAETSNADQLTSKVLENSLPVSSIAENQKEVQHPVMRRRKRKIVYTALKKKRSIVKLEIKSQNQKLGCKRPGRPKKHPTEVDNISVIETSKSKIKNEGMNLTPILPVQSTTTSVPEECFALVQNNEMLHRLDINNKTLLYNSINDIPDTGLPQNQEMPSNLDMEKDELQRLKTSSSTSDDSTNQLESTSEQNISNLGTSKAKSKDTQFNTWEAGLVVGIKDISELGQDLAGQMRKNMQVPFENVPSANLTRPGDDSNFNDTSGTPSDMKASLSKECQDICKNIKKEFETFDLGKSHACPYCRLNFAYLSNFKRHLTICKARPEISEVEPVPSTSALKQYLPKKDEVEHSMLNLLRHQSRTTQMIKESTKGDSCESGTKFQSYTCKECHHIFLTLFNFIQHQVTHKLGRQNSEQSTLDNANELNAVENVSSLTDFTKNISQDDEIRNIDESILIKSVIADQGPISAQTFDNNDISQSISVPNNSEINAELLVKSKCSPLELEDCSQSRNVFIESNILNSQAPQIAQSVDSSANFVSDLTVKVPIKRKRGRPFGWRKYPDVLTDNLKSGSSNKISKVSNKRNTVLNVRGNVGKLHSLSIKRGRKKINVTSLKAKPINVVNTVKKAMLSKQLKLVANPENSLVPFNKDHEVKPENLDVFAFTESPIIMKEQLKVSPKHNIMKHIAMENDAPTDNLKVISGNKVPKSPKNILHQSTKGKPSASVTQIVKRRGRPPACAKIYDSIISKSNLPVKRRPGRPPKNLQSIPSTSQSKIFYSDPNSTRSFRKIISKPICDSSDSEFEIPEKPAISKVYINCPNCKEQFRSSLVLLRHIQLIHTRQSKSTSIKTETLNTITSLKNVTSNDKVGTDDILQNSTKVIKKVIENPVIDNKSDTESNNLANNIHVSKKVKMSPKNIYVELNAGGNTLSNSKKVFRKADGGATLVSGIKINPKLISDSKSDTFSNNSVNNVNVLKKIFSKSIATDKLNIDSNISVRSRVLKKENPKYLTASNKYDSNSNNLTKSITKVLKRGKLKHVDKSDTDSIISENSVKVLKKVKPNPVTMDKSDTNIVLANSPKVLKKGSANKYDSDSNSLIKSIKVLKKGKLKRVAIDKSDTDSIISENSVKVLKKVKLSPVTTDKSDTNIVLANSPNVLKKGNLKLAANKLDTDGIILGNSVKVLKKVKQKSVTTDKLATNNIVSANSVKVLKKTYPKPTTADKLDTDSIVLANSGKVPLKKGKSRSVITDRSDSDSIVSANSVKVPLKKGKSKSVVTDRSDTDSNSSPKSVKAPKRVISNIVAVNKSTTGSNISTKPGVTLVKKLMNSKICPICKEKFNTSKLLSDHIQKLHNRRSQPVAVRSEPVRPASTSMKIKKLIEKASRSTLSRQCRKPLPSMKRRNKKGFSEDEAKIPKLN